MAKFYSTGSLGYKDVAPSIRRALASLPDAFHVCLDFGAKKGFDVVVIHRKGISVVEVKNETRIVTGGPAMPYWRIEHEDGTLIANNRGNFYNQAKLCADTLKQYLWDRSRQIFLNQCSRPPCSSRLCSKHREFWSACRVYPYVCIPFWNSRNSIDPDNTGWCWMVQGDESQQEPPYLIDGLLRRDWSRSDHTRNLSLTDDQIARVISVLGLKEISFDEALGQTFRWQPTLDERVEISLREKELTDLQASLQTCPVLAIVGEPKIGKTSLSQLLAIELQKQGMTILEHDFRLDPLGVMLERFLTKTRTPPQLGVQDNITTFLGVLVNERICVLLQNFECLLDKLTISDPALSRMIDTLLASKSSLQSFVIITSQYPVSTKTKTKCPDFSLLGIEKENAIRHLTQKYGWSENEADHIYNIREGHPHAMHISSEEIRNTMELGFSFEEALERLGQQVVESIYGEHYAAFTPGEKRVTEIVALHPKGIDIKGVEWIAGHLRMSEPVIEVIGRLHQKGAISKSAARWVQILPQDQPFVYASIPDKDKLHQAALAYHKKKISTLTLNQASIEENEEEYIYALHHALRAKEPKEGWSIVFKSPWSRELQVLGKFDTLAFLCKQILDCEGFEALSAGEKARTFLSLGEAKRRLGEVDSAENYLTRAEQLSCEVSDVLLQAGALAELGVIKRKKGQLGQVELEYYDLALAALNGREDIEAKRLQGGILVLYGKALEYAGRDAEEVLKCHHKALDLGREINDPSRVVWRLGMLGVAYRELRRDFPRAIRYLEESLEIGKQLGSEAQIVAALAGLGKTYEKWGKPEHAKRLYQQAMEKTRASDVYGMLDRLGTLAHVHTRFKEYEESENYYTKALELARKIQNKKAEAENLAGIGAVFRTQASGEREESKKLLLLQKAKDCHEKAVEIQESLQGDFAGLTNRYQELGRTLFALGEFSRSKEYIIKAVHSARRGKREFLEAWQFTRLGDIFDKEGQREEAVLSYEKAIILFGKFGSRKEIQNPAQQKEKILKKMDPAVRKTVETRLKSLDEEIEKIILPQSSLTDPQ